MTDATFRRRWMVARILGSCASGLRVSEIHARLEGSCSLRTIYRDLRALQEVGLALYADSFGRWHLLCGSGEPVFGLRCTWWQLAALRLAEAALACWSGSEALRALAELRRRAEASLPAERRMARPEAGRRPLGGRALSSGFLARPARPSRPVPPATWAIIEEAIAEGLCLRLWEEQSGPRWREVHIHPAALVERGGQVFLLGWCDALGAAHAVPLVRVRRAQTAEPADPARLALVDADAYWGRLFGVEDGPAYRVTLRLSGAAAREARERPLHPEQRMRVEGPDQVVVLMEVAGLGELARWVAGHGGDAVPLAPPELVEAVRTLHCLGLAALSRDTS